MARKFKRGNKKVKHGRFRRYAGLALKGASYAMKGVGMGITAYKLARRLQDVVNTEYKYYDTNSSITPDYSGSLTILNPITQGTTDVARVGDSVKIQNLTLRGYLSANAAAAASVRMMVIWDPQNKSSAVSDILEYTGTVIAPYSPKKYDNRFQTRVLYDKQFTTVPTSESAIRHFDLVLPINLHTQFNAGTTTINTGALKILFISTNAASLPSVNYLARISYTDN